MDELKAWLKAEQPKHPPRSAMGEAIHYALAQWDALCTLLADARLPVDSNPSERALRIVALAPCLPASSSSPPRLPALCRFTSTHVRSRRVRYRQGMPVHQGFAANWCAPSPC